MARRSISRPCSGRRAYAPHWEGATVAERMKSLVTDLNVCSNKGLGERFDSTIGAATVLMPFGGERQLTPAQAMVAKFPVDGETSTASAWRGASIPSSWRKTSSRVRISRSWKALRALLPQASRVMPHTFPSRNTSSACAMFPSGGANPWRLCSAPGGADRLGHWCYWRQRFHVGLF